MKRYIAAEDLKSLILEVIAGVAIQVHVKHASCYCSYVPN